MRALILGAPIPQTARVVWRWLASGHEIEEVWIAHNAAVVWHRRDRRLQWLAPTWSLRAAARRFGFRIRAVKPLARQPALVRESLRSSVDVVLSVLFPYVVPDEMLTYYRGRACNLHPALLPAYGGPCPMVQMIVDEQMSASGMTLHVMTPGLDEGDIIGSRAVAWPSDRWFRTWEADLSDAAAALAVEELPRFLADKIPAIPQSGPRSYFKQVAPGALSIDSSTSERRARWLGGSLGRIMPLRYLTAGGAIAVGDVAASLGQPRALPARVGTYRVEGDLADARVTFRRWSRWHRQVERVRELAALARRPLAA